MALAMERPVEERAAFIGKRCGNDAELKSEVESLLAVAEDAGDFFDSLAGRESMTVARPISIVTGSEAR